MALARIFKGLSLILLLSCIPLPHKKTRVPIRKIPRLALQRLKSQSSFKFHYRLKKEEPPLLWEFDVSCILPHIEEIKGEREFGVEKEKVYLIGFGDREYIKKGKRWEVHPRGEETKLWNQIERAMSLGGFKFMREDSRYYYFRFSPNVPFLDPTFKKKILGEFIISKAKLLPKEIRAYDTFHTCKWEISFTSYSKKIEIRIPFEPQFRVVLESKDKISKEERETLKRRFQLYGIGVRIEGKGRELTLLIDRVIDMESLKELIEPGEGGIYSIEWEKEGKFHPPGDFSRSFSLKRRVVSLKEIEAARVEFDNLSRPFLTLQLTSSEKFSLKKSYALLIDQEVIGVFYLDNPPPEGIIKIENLSYYKAMMSRSKIISGPLRIRLRITAGEKI